MRSGSELKGEFWLRVRLGSRLLLACLALMAGLGACGDGKSFVLARMLLLPNQEPLPNVASIRVDITAGPLSDTLTYPAKGGSALTLSATQDRSLSVSFSDELQGSALLAITALGADGMTLGYGTAEFKILEGRVAYSTVYVDRTRTGPVVEGGVPDAGVDGRVDTAPKPSLLCTPHTAGGCGPNQTCGVSCFADEPTTVCRAAGTKQPGEICVEGDCAPGSQCLTDTCGVKVCRRFCQDDQDCPTGGSCFTAIQCNMISRPSGVRICSQPCDPRGSAKTGCADGLRCFLFFPQAGKAVSDCDCVAPAPMRVKGDGIICANTDECVPGLLCITMDGASRCRPICRLDQPGTCQGGRICQMHTNPAYDVYGACVP